MKWDARRALSSSLLCAALALGEFGCGSSSPIVVTVTPTTATANPGQPISLTATTSNNSMVSWSVSCSTPPCGTVSPASTPSAVATTYTAPAIALANNLSIMVTASASSSSASATVTLPPYQAAVSSDSSQVNPGMTAHFSAQTVNGPANAMFNWALSCSPAPCGTLSPTTTQSLANTTYTAPSTVPVAGLTVTYTAQSTANPSITASGTIQVLGVIVSVTSSSANVDANGTQPLIATASNDPTNSGVTWSVSCSPAPCGTVPSGPSPSGVPINYTAPPPPANDLNVTVTATSVAYSPATASVTLTVPALVVAISPGSALLPLTNTLQLTGTVAYDLANAGVTWMLTQSGSPCAPACGSISVSNPTTFTAPAVLPASSAVLLTATSVTDSTKSADATINLSSGTVEIVPQSWNFGRRVVNTSSSPQAFILTNTGLGALTISGMSFTGANPKDFSQTNTCPSSMAAATSCTISIVFTPSERAQLSASLSITDSSTDSPQQISVSGTGFTRGETDVAAVQAALASSATAIIPLPTGPERVGTRVVDWKNPSQPDPFHAGAARELLVRFWYPALLDQRCELAEYNSSKVWGYFSRLLGTPLPAVTTNSCLNAKVASGTHPIVVFTPGYTGTFTDYTFIFEELASRGYVVASVNHTYEATATEFPDGKFVPSLLGSYLNGTWRGDDKTLDLAASVRLRDLRYVLDQLQVINTSAADPFVGRLDLSRIAIAGHSAGGTVAFRALEQDSRFKAAVILDAFLSGAQIRPTNKPVLILKAGSPSLSAVSDLCESRLLRGPHSVVNLSGAEHVAPSDALWLAPGAIAAGPMGPDHTLAIIRDSITTFLDANLLQQRNDPGPASASSIVAGAKLTNGEQSCSQP